MEHLDFLRIKTMNKTLLILLGFAVGCGGGATWLAFAKDEPAVAAVLQPLPPQLELVLVATHELSSGSVIQASDLAWQGWPRNTALKGVIRRSEAPAAINEIKDSVLRGAVVAGEPIRREKLAKGGNPGDLSAILAPGHSAVAIAIEGGATADGASILPNDRVDVIHATREKLGLRSGLRDASVRKTLVANVRVLAMAPNAPDKRGQTGSTATLDLDSQQAETVILAQRNGPLSLTPHPAQDARKSGPILALEDKRERASR
jgi:pilus assembly protein CpaB